MVFEHFLDNLKLDLWYKVLVLIGSVVFISSLIVPIYAISNKQAMFLSLGILLIGLGEWKNHKVLSNFKPPNAYTGGPALIQRLVRMPDLLGNLMVTIGLILIILTFSDIMNIITIFH